MKNTENKEECVSKFINVDIAEVAVIYNPRKNFDKEGMAKLVASVKAHGVMQPISIRYGEDGGVKLVAGERRLRAAKAAGIDTLPAVVLNVNEHEARELALVENLEREDLDVLEEAEAFHDLMACGYSVVELAERFGYSREYINSRLELRKLDEGVKSAVLDGEITLKTARALGRLELEKSRALALKGVVKPEYQVQPLTQERALELIKNDFLEPQEKAKKWNSMRELLEREHPGVEFVPYGENPKGYVALEEALRLDEAVEYGTQWKALAKRYKVPMQMRYGGECNPVFWAKKSLMETADAQVKQGFFLKRKEKGMFSKEGLAAVESAAKELAAHKELLEKEWRKELYEKVVAGELSNEAFLKVAIAVSDFCFMHELEVVLGVLFPGESFVERRSDENEAQAKEMLVELLSDEKGAQKLLGLLVLYKIECFCADIHSSLDERDEKYDILQEDREEGE